MNDKFEELVRDAAPATPDPGEFRRLHRAVLQDRIREMDRRRRRRRFPAQVAVAVLAVLVLFTGQVSELGSDDFEIQTLLEKPDYSFVRVGHRQQPVQLIEGFDESDVAELVTQDLLDEGIPIELLGIVLADAVSWTVAKETLVNGKRSVRGRQIKGFPHKNSLELIQFVSSETYRQVAAQMDAEPPLVPCEIGSMEAEEVRFRTLTHTFEDPVFGKVVLTRGKPIR